MGEKKGINRIFNFLLAIGLGIYAVAQSLVHNPDTDAYFLIDIGRYVFNHHAVPREAYWYIKDGLHTIVQQWLCGFLNYMAYMLGKDWGLVVLGILFNGTLLLALYMYAKEFSKDKALGFYAAVFCWILLNQFVSTRPYAITAVFSIFEVLIIRKFSGKEKPTAKEFVFFIAKISAVFVFIANWQASNILFLCLFMFCFIPKFKDKRFSVNWRVLAAMAVGIAATLLNPNGLDGTLYLVYSKDYITPFKIVECVPPKLISINTFLIILVAVLMINGLIKRKITSDEFFLAAGCILMSCLFMRCGWTLVLPLIPLIRNVKFTPGSNKILKIGFILAGFLCISQIAIFFLEKTNDRYDMVKVLPGPEKTVLYTDFNSGAFFLLDNYKIYYDARPEILGREIAGEESFFDEAVGTWFGTVDYNAFIEKYGFNYFAASFNTPMDGYLASKPDKYKLIFTNNKDEINVYQAI